MKRVMGSQLVIRKGVNSGLVVFNLVDNAFVESRSVSWPGKMEHRGSKKIEKLLK